MSNASVSSIASGYSVNAGGDDSWLSAIAKALAKVMGKLQDRMKDDANKLNASDGKDNTAQTDLTVATQEYTLVVQAINNVLKTAGDADANLVRKN